MKDKNSKLLLSIRYKFYAIHCSFPRVSVLKGRNIALAVIQKLILEHYDQDNIFCVPFVFVSSSERNMSLELIFLKLSYNTILNEFILGILESKGLK